MHIPSGKSSFSEENPNDSPILPEGFYNMRFIYKVLY